MSRQPPYLAMDGVLIDRPQPGCVVGKFRDNISNTTKKEPQKMKTMSTSDAATYARLFVKNRAVANRFWAKCMGQDATMQVFSKATPQPAPLDASSVTREPERSCKRDIAPHEENSG